MDTKVRAQRVKTARRVADWLYPMYVEAGYTVESGAFTTGRAGDIRQDLEGVKNVVRDAEKYLKRMEAISKSSFLSAQSRSKLLRLSVDKCHRLCQHALQQSSHATDCANQIKMHSLTPPEEGVTHDRIFRGYLCLMEAFGDRIQFNRDKNPSISYVTDPVVLTRKGQQFEFGRYQIVFRPTEEILRADNVHITESIEVLPIDAPGYVYNARREVGKLYRRREPVALVVDGKDHNAYYFHPHVYYDGSFCLNEMDGPVCNAISNGDLMSLMDTVIYFATHYHESDTYRKLNCWRWAKTLCHVCDEPVEPFSRERVFCRASNLCVHRRCCRVDLNGYMVSKKKPMRMFRTEVMPPNTEPVNAYTRTPEGFLGLENVPAIYAEMPDTVAVHVTKDMARCAVSGVPVIAPYVPDIHVGLKLTDGRFDGAMLSEGIVVHKNHYLLATLLMEIPDDIKKQLPFEPEAIASARAEAEVYFGRFGGLAYGAERLRELPGLLAVGRRDAYRGEG